MRCWGGVAENLPANVLDDLHALKLKTLFSTGDIYCGNQVNSATVCWIMADGTPYVNYTWEPQPDGLPVILGVN